MAEYSREQRNQLSRAVANSEVGSRQLKEIVDNRYQMKNFTDYYSENDIMQCQSEVSYTTQKIKAYPSGIAYDAGKKMVADLDKNDPKAGYAPKTGTFSEIMNNPPFNASLGVRGHLLNDHLGGPGEQYNLMPISSQANHLHLTHVENFVKSLLRHSSATNRLHYEVEATPESPSDMLTKPQVTFDCKWWLTGNKSGTEDGDLITSTPAGIKKYRGEAEGEGTTTYSNKDLLSATGWGAIDDRKNVVGSFLQPLTGKINGK